MKSDHRTIQNVFHTQGLEGIARLIDEGASHYSLRKTLKRLRDAGINGQADELEGLLLERGVLKPRHKPSKPGPGDERPFSIQQGRGTRYIRLPVDKSFPDKKPGDVLYAAFGDGGIDVNDKPNGEQ